MSDSVSCKKKLDMEKTTGNKQNFVDFTSILNAKKRTLNLLNHNWTIDFCRIQFGLNEKSKHTFIDDVIFSKWVLCV